jgi:hypothetical protein
MSPGGLSGRSLFPKRETGAASSSPMSGGSEEFGDAYKVSMFSVVYQEVLSE